MSGRGARQRRKARRKLFRHPEVLITPKQPIKYLEVYGSPRGLLFAYLTVTILLTLVIIL